MTIRSQRPCRLAFRRAVDLIMDQGHLGVDNYVAIAGKVDDHIRLSSPAIF